MCLLLYSTLGIDPKHDDDIELQGIGCALAALMSVLLRFQAVNLVPGLLVKQSRRFGVAGSCGSYERYLLDIISF